MRLSGVPFFENTRKNFKLNLVLVLVLVPNLKLSIQRNARRSLRKIGIWILGFWG